MTAVYQPYPMERGRRAQVWHYQPAYRRPQHVHEEPEINLVTRGQGIIEIGSRTLEVKTGSLVWFAPGIEHYLAGASDDFELITVGFQPELLAAYAREHDAAPQFTRAIQQLGEIRCIQLAQVLRALPSLADPTPGEAVAIGLLRELSDLPLDHTKRLGSRAAAQVLNQPAITRDQLASRLGSNRGDVSRAFRRDHGVTLRHYRCTLRVLEFLRRVDSGTENLTRAAIEAGFGSYSQCHRVFSAALGCSPRHYVAERMRESIGNQFEPLREFTEF